MNEAEAVKQLRFELYKARQVRTVRGLLQLSDLLHVPLLQSYLGR